MSDAVESERNELGIIRVEPIPVAKNMQLTRWLLAFLAARPAHRQFEVSRTGWVV